MDLKKQVIKEQTDKICEQYKISKEEVSKILLNKLENNPDLLNLATGSATTKEVYRTKKFKDFIKKTKKEIYYDLRTYKKESDNLISSHISSKERAPYIKNLFKQIDGYLKNAETVLDLGGGLFPASFPFEKYPKLKTYVWVDKDKNAYQALKDQNYKKVFLHNYSIGEKDWDYYLPDDKKKFDFVFMLKLIPVIYRQHRELLRHVSETPFKYALVTGSKESMVKKQDIESRENKVITGFITNSGKKIVKKIDLPNEFGYLIQ